MPNVIIKSRKDFDNNVIQGVDQMFRKKGFWRFWEMVAGAGFLFSLELLLLLYIFFEWDFFFFGKKTMLQSPWRLACGNYRKYALSSTVLEKGNFFCMGYPDKDYEF